MTESDARISIIIEHNVTEARPGIVDELISRVVSNFSTRTKSYVKSLHGGKQLVD